MDFQDQSSSFYDFKTENGLSWQRTVLWDRKLCQWFQDSIYQSRGQVPRLYILEHLALVQPTMVLHDQKSVYHMITIRWRFCFLDYLGVFPFHILKRDGNKNGDIFWTNHYSKQIPGTSDAVRLIMYIITIENCLCLLSWQKADLSCLLDIISGNFGEFKDDTKLINVTMLNVTEDAAMISHKENLLHLFKAGGDTISEIILVCFPFSSVRDGKDGDILKIINYLKQVFRGQS